MSGSSVRNIRLISLNTGMPALLDYQGKKVESGIFKSPVTRPIPLTATGFEGDGQADLVHHGGEDKAVCVYPYEHYRYWQERLSLELEKGAFGENLTLSGLTEDRVCIGDSFRIGKAVVQISQPRQPCFKLSARYGLPELPRWIEEQGFTGYYFRVLQEGLVGPEDSIELLEQDPAGITVEFANQIMHHRENDEDGLRKLLAVGALSRSWRHTLTKRWEALQG